MKIATIKNNKKAMKNIRRLRACREAKKITQCELAKILGLNNVSTIFSYESGAYYPSLEIYNKLARFFGWEIIEPPPIKTKGKVKMKSKPKVTLKHLFDDEDNEDETLWAKAKKAEEERLKKKVQEREKALSFSFNNDKCYKIDGFVFKYLGEQGIHHYFQEINGGWTRTYTDVQLIGRKIK